MHVKRREINLLGWKRWEAVENGVAEPSIDQWFIVCNATGGTESGQTELGAFEWRTARPHHGRGYGEPRQSQAATRRRWNQETSRASRKWNLCLSLPFSLPAPFSFVCFPHAKRGSLTVWYWTIGSTRFTITAYNRRWHSMPAGIPRPCLQEFQVKIALGRLRCHLPAFWISQLLVRCKVNVSPLFEGHLKWLELTKNSWFLFDFFVCLPLLFKLNVLLLVNVFFVFCFFFNFI